MSIRSQALQWFRSKFGAPYGKICSSKFYQPEESRTRDETWWLEFPIGDLDENNEIHLLCQVAPNSDDFHYLKVPASFFQEQLKNLDVRDGNKISLYLSPKPSNMFVDERGNGRVDFSKFLVSNIYS